MPVVGLEWGHLSRDHGEGEPKLTHVPSEYMKIKSQEALTIG